MAKWYPMYLDVTPVYNELVASQLPTGTTTSNLVWHVIQHRYSLKFESRVKSIGKKKNSTPMHFYMFGAIEYQAYIILKFKSKNDFLRTKMILCQFIKEPGDIATKPQWLLKQGKN